MMNKRFFKYLLLFAAAIAVKSNGFAQNRDAATLSQRIFGPSSYSNRDNNNYPYIYFLGSPNSSQIYRSQSQRPVNFLKAPFVYTNKFRTYCKSLNNIFQRAGSGYVRSCKLILFPFHVFW
jgi:hypothetical protein